ncbi:copper-binding protein [Agitococcus lubricus]|uniref:Putative cupredoxin-like copper-binding protein n=1 Tax=Agitococcus lubricus TaxID=1077255 RepID=A0A2T5IX66_9GAMM|nr:copper-binding protein [Agitococcus lubricus]PTQ88543.1 putative cupredoxin-like copper-binding protein [Agitococcus lubricus]
MNSKKHNLLALALVIPTLFSPLLVWAHGDEHLDPNMKVDNPITAQTQAVGQQGMPRDVSRTIEIGMNDMLRFNPDNLLVKQGETIRLRITNNGKIPHEFVLGTRDEIMQHAQMMKSMPTMVHSSANIAHVLPSKSTDIIWQFSQAGEFVFACLIPGHLPAGMEGKITVTASPEQSSSATPVAATELKTEATDTTTAVDDRYTQGEIRKVDTAQGKLTIKHGDIKNLGMLGMTMVFRVKDPAMVKTVKAGDAVQFVVELEKGLMVITELKKVTGK